MLKGNKGEWSEFYAFLKLLAEGKIYAADKDLNKNEKLFYLILKIIRNENGKLEYLRNEKIYIQRSTGEILTEIPIKKIIDYSNQLFEGIKNAETGQRAFSLNFMSNIFKKLYTTKLSDDKVETSDIRIVIHDPILQTQQLQGFSIKSYIGGKPTLFNASKNTNLIYRILPELTPDLVLKINSLETYSKRIDWLIKNNYKLSFIKMYSDIFKTNLEMIDSRLPEILAHWLLYRYISGTNTLVKLTDYLTNSNPCHFNIDLNPNFYNRKIKDMLVDMSLGMQAGKIWDGTFNVTGGYIAVKKDGDLVCYHIYNKNEFQEYLINHTKIDFPDSSPNRCDFGRVLNSKEVNESEGYFIKLNFQIRFK